VIAYWITAVALVVVGYWYAMGMNDFYYLGRYGGLYGHKADYLALILLAGSIMLLVPLFDTILKIENRFLAGSLTTAFVFFLGWFVKESIKSAKAGKEYDDAMTSMMNMVPKDQRFGYTEDFPDNTRWRL
jgi:hypothetical protein